MNKRVFAQGVMRPANMIWLVAVAGTILLIAYARTQTRVVALKKIKSRDKNKGIPQSFYLK